VFSVLKLLKLETINTENTKDTENTYRNIPVHCCHLIDNSGTAAPSFRGSDAP